jgi:hypothetical protein
MKELFLTVLKYYAITGGVCALLATAWICFLSVKANVILDRGNTVRVKDGPSFTPNCDRMRMGDYFVICRAFGTSVITFLLWPLMLYILFTDPKWWCMVEEVKTE